MAKTKDVKVVQDPEKPVTAEVLAKSIVAVSEAAKKLLNGPLTEEAVVILIHAAAGGSVGKPDIRTVLRTAALLRETYVRS